MAKEKNQENREIKRRRKEYTSQFFKKNKILLVLGFLAFALVNGMNVVIGIIDKMYVDFFTGDSSLTLPKIILYTTSMLAAYAVAGILFSFAVPACTKRAMQQYKAYSFAKLTEKSISSFSKENTARYISIMTNDADKVKQGYIGTEMTILSSALCFVAAVVCALQFSVVLTILCFISAMLPMFTGALGGNAMEKAEKKLSDQNELFMGGLKDWLSGFSVIKSFKAEKPVNAVFKKENADLEQAHAHSEKTQGIVDVVLGVIGTADRYLILAIGLIMKLAGADFTLGTLIAVQTIKNTFDWPLMVIPMQLAQRKAAIGLIDKQAALLAENVRSEGEVLPEPFHKAICFDKVSFAYEEGKPILKDFSQCFEAGKSYALVGASGSGKSTILNLLMGGAEHYEGSISMDGKEICALSGESLYRQLALIQQNVFVFNDTILNNVTMFQEFPKEQVQKALQMSGLNGLIERRGEDAACGENGNELSGGEKQRISIARAILYNAPVMLVDEATAALDANTSYTVMKSILEIPKLTRIVVTHRLEAELLNKYDEILMLQNGVVCEKGTFEELLQKQGSFYAMYTVAQNA